MQSVKSPGAPGGIGLGGCHTVISDAVPIVAASRCRYSSFGRVVGAESHERNAEVQPLFYTGGCPLDFTSLKKEESANEASGCRESVHVKK